MILDLTTKKLQVVLAGAITTNQLQINTSWGDTQSGDTFVPGATSALTNNATPVDIVAAPAASMQRTVREVTVFNADTVAATVTVQTVDGANTRINTMNTIQSGETLTFANGRWETLTTSGAVKGSAGVSSVALTVPARQTVAGSPITTSGTLAVTDNTQAANIVFAGPVSGGAATPAFRALVNADMPATGAGSGTVTSVALSLPAIITVTGSPVTTNGTLTGTLATQTANTLFAGPVSGGAATPAFRTLVAADLNSLAFTSGAVPFGSATGGLTQDATRLFYDPVNFRLALGVTTPDVKLTVSGNTIAASPFTPPPNTLYHSLGVDGSNNQFVMDCFAGAGLTNTATITCRTFAGTAAAPTAVLSGQRMLALVAFGGQSSTLVRAGGFLTFQAAENWSGTAVGTDLTIALTLAGTTTNATRATLFNDGRFQPTGAYCDLSYSYQTPLTGATITQADTSETLICDPAAGIAALTVNTPANPKDGQRFQFTCTQAVTLLTIQANAGQTLKAPIAAVYVANTAFGWQYRLANTTWYRVHN